MLNDDFLEHFRLNDRVLPDHTLHIAYRGSTRIEEKWTATQMIGRGAFGEVWKQECAPDAPAAVTGTRIRAVKSINKKLTEDLGVDFKKELIALSKFSKEEYRQTEAFVSFLGWYEMGESVFLAMEYFRHGDLAGHVGNIQHERDIKDITVGVLRGLEIMHAEGFAHRDLKPQNIFVMQRPPESQHWRVKIGDFGISKRVSGDTTALRTRVGTPLYQAPEVMDMLSSIDPRQTSEYDQAVDMWSLGCVVYNLATGTVPFTSVGEIYRFCFGMKMLPEAPMDQKIGSFGASFVKKLLQPLPADRMSANDAMSDAWLNGHTSTLDYEEIPSPSLGASVVETAETNKNNGDNELMHRNARQGSLHDLPRDDGTASIGSHMASSPKSSTQFAESTSSNQTKGSWRRSYSVRLPDFYFLSRLAMGTSDFPPAAAFLPDNRIIEHTAKAHLLTVRGLEDERVEAISFPGLEEKLKIKLGRFHTVVSVSPTGLSIAMAYPESSSNSTRGWDGQVSFVELQNQTFQSEVCSSVEAFWGFSARLQTLKHSRDGKLLLCSSSQKRHMLWDLETKREIFFERRLGSGEPKGRNVPIVTFSGDNREVATATCSEWLEVDRDPSDVNSTIEVWDTGTGLLKRSRRFTEIIVDFSFLPSEPGFMTLVLHGKDRPWWESTVMRWDVARNSIQSRTPFQHNLTSDLPPVPSFSPDGTTFASSHLKAHKLNQRRDGLIEIRDSVTMALQQTLSHAGEGKSLSFSPDGRFLLVHIMDTNERPWYESLIVYRLEEGETDLGADEPLDDPAILDRVGT